MDPNLDFQKPSQDQPPYNHQGDPNPYNYRNDNNHNHPSPSNGFSTACLIMGILSVVSICGCLGFNIIFSFLGFIFYILSKEGGTVVPNNSRVGLILSIIGLVLGVVLLILVIGVYFNIADFPTYEMINPR